MKRWLWIILVCVCAMTAAAQTKKAPARRKRVGIKPIKERIMTENIKIDEKLAAEMKAGMERIRQVKAEYCEITGLEFVPNGAYVSSDGHPEPHLPNFVAVQYVLRPTAESYIRCELWLPKAEKWTGNLWAGGNGGRAGNVPEGFLRSQIRTYDASVTTDMGSSKNVSNPEVWKDFGWRSTHLMTVVAKQFVEAFYGRKPSYSYFTGSSTGGGQAMMEVQRYPEDFDGVLCGVPALWRIPNFLYFLNLRRCTHDMDGKLVFTAEQMDNVSKAAVEYLAAREEPYAAGRFITNPEYSKEAADAIVERAAAMEPKMNDDQKARVAKMLEGPFLNGKRVLNGIPFTASIKTMADRGIWCLNWYFGNDADFMKLTDEQLTEFVKAFANDFNARDYDMRPFEAHGGKIIVYAGTEDPICPYHVAAGYLGRAAKLLGGWDKLSPFCRFYLLPGRAHGGGNGVQSLVNLQKVIRDWREKGIAPEVLDGKMKDGTIVPVAPYPDKMSGDLKDGLKRVKSEPIKLAEPDEFFLFAK